MVDFASTRRPMLFFAYDLDAYQTDDRGFHIEYEKTVPGPVLRTADELVDAVREADRVRTDHDERYSAFRERFCELDDGRAAARVVDRLFPHAVIGSSAS
jgi:CDP-glycerol glycerophosphotransferase